MNPNATGSFAYSMQASPSTQSINKRKSSDLSLNDESIEDKKERLFKWNMF